MRTSSVALCGDTLGNAGSVAPGPAPAAALRATSPTHPQLGKELVFEEETEHAALIRAGHGQASAVTRQLFTCNWPLLFLYASAFLSFLPSSPWSLPVPTVDSSLRHLGLTQSQNAISLHLTVPHAPKLWPFSGYGVTQIASPMDLWWWVSP